DHAEAVGVVDVEQRVVLAGDGGEGGQVGHVAGHAVDAVHAHQAGGAGGHLGQSPVEVTGVVGGEPAHGRALTGGDGGPVVDRLVGLLVDQDPALPGEHRDDGRMDVGDGRQDQRVGCAEEVGELLLDVAVQPRAAEEARPARVGAPPAQGVRDAVHDLGVEVE